MIVSVISFLIAVLMIVSVWIIFTKAGQPGWAVLIPIYDLIVFLNVAKKPWWWIFLFLIPVVNIVFLIMMIHAISVNFGKGAGFTLGLIFLFFIFLPILAFGDASYQVDDAVSSEAPAEPAPEAPEEKKEE